MMNHTEKLTRYTANFVDELVCSGLRHVVISPGSRSTPLAILCTEHKRLKEWILIDERSAAYFALGIAKKTKKAVALVCTSGTAAANYFPAIVEAHYARVPLIVLTADRPHELRDIGASQTIDQMNMYGQFVKDFIEMALPEHTPEMLRYVRSKAARAVRESEQGSQGPVHLNFPFREPLLPNLQLENMWGKPDSSCFNFAYEGEKRLAKQPLQSLFDNIRLTKNGLIVCGPQVDEHLSEQITALGERFNIPILADPLSQLRAGSHRKSTIISTYDAILRSDELRKKLKPDYIIRFGAMPISKNYLFYIQEHSDSLQIVVEDHELVREPTNHPSEYIFADGTLLCKDLLSISPYIDTDRNWLKRWQQMNTNVIEEMCEEEEGSVTEGKAVQRLLQVIPDRSSLFVGNSMPVRDLDTFFIPTDKQITVHANRGVSGIDGTVSSALGVAATTDEHVTLIIGDLSFYHDLNSLLVSKQYQINMTILLINNNGGGIFSFLPQANEKNHHFEALFGTPLHIEFEKAVSMYGGNYTSVSTMEDLELALKTAYDTTGVSVVEVKTDRAENVIWHQKLWEKIEHRLMQDEC